MKFVVVLAALITISYGQTHAPHTGSTHEPSVHQSFSFSYDYHTQKMVVVNHQNCYIFSLTDQEKLDVHTNTGMTTLELKLLPLVHSGTKTEVQKSSLSASIVHACGQNTKHYFTMD
ncbi:hypothetical protein CHS0354_014848 [Potamilus streckersoni]|uniref:Uncharacterized protein n=1 Tax=Potamilus streckersoni TaxID=2493646 RepID=A0AAE0RVN2_9BIVA|nr:hypothetical protein CHS0354_014848 [Potamilus streckersoni]